MPSSVLLVEDNAIVAMTAEAQLLEIGVGRVVLAASVAQALAHCREERFDFALLDFDLGTETSAEVAAFLKAAGVPFVFASGYGASITLPEGLLGTPFLHKPYLLEDLERVIRPDG